MLRPAFFLVLFLSLAQARAQSPAASPASSASPAPSAPAAPGAPAATAAPPPPGISGATTAIRTAPSGGGTAISFSHANVDGPYIAMTFDDGPSGPNTPRLLDLAAKKHIKLTFFLIGQNAQTYPALVQRELAEGHQVGNHSWSHPNLAKMSDAAVRAELQKTQDAIINATGYRPILMRPPYGSITPSQRLWISREFGFKIILWEVDPDDWKHPHGMSDADFTNVVANRIIAGTRPGSIILSHDIHATTIAAMPRVFDTLLAKGFKFVTVSELIAMDKGKPRKTAALPAVPPAMIPASTQ